MYLDEYQSKLTTPEKAVAAIQNGATIIYSMAACEPPALLGAIADRVRAVELEGLKVYSLLPLEHVANTILAPDIADKVDVYSWFVSGLDRELIKEGVHHFVPMEFHQLPDLIRDYMDVDTVVAAVSPMDKAGYFSFGLSNDYVTTAARNCRRLILEVNPNMPRVFGESSIHISEVGAVIENEAPLLELVPGLPKPEAEPIGRAIAEMIPDGATLQLGVGGIPDAVTNYLENHRDLGIHTELLGPGMVKLIKKGVVTGAKKNLHPRKHVFTNACGDAEMYEFMNDNPAMVSYPVDYTNKPHIIAQNDNFISINSTLEVDLLGQCNSEYLGGFEYSGTGGQLDFVRGAFHSKGG